jgi:hypothetical protein
MWCDGAWGMEFSGATFHDGYNAPAAVPTTPTTPVTLTPLRPRLCKFYSMGGGCTRGSDCPYSHELSVRASTAAAAKAGFVFVTGVANIGGATNVESPEGQGAPATPFRSPIQQQQQGLNPTAQAFEFVPQSYTDENSASGSSTWAVEHHNHGQAYHGASEHLVGHAQPPVMYPEEQHWQHQHHHHQPQQGHEAGLFYGPGPHQSHYMPAMQHLETPPTFTQRRRVPYVELNEDIPQPVFDYASRHAQAMRPALELRGKANALSPVPTARPRPPLQALGNAAGDEHFVPWQGVY